MKGRFSMKTTVHIISHSHWDREWYLPFETHRMRLVELLDNILELFEKDENYRNFFLDGQTIALDDYLEIRPQKRGLVEKYVREGRLWTGPWYILQDEFLTSGESCVRNLLTGMESAGQYGKVSHVGYFPDAFGNAGQMPQVLKQAGMEAVAFGRGVKPVGLNNEVKGGTYESTFSEMNWESMDGSSLPGILFANWYNNGMEIPVEEDKAKEYWDEHLQKVRQFAGTSHLLLMNGCDHQPVQKNLSEAIETARRLYPDIEFVHSDFETYAKAIKSEMTENTSTVKGELISQETDGCWTLVNTCSANADLKVANRQAESALERRAEPSSAMASLMGKEYPSDFLKYSWKMLMQNHPHDSICGCSVDEVNDEIETRFKKSRQVADEICKASLAYTAANIDTTPTFASDDKKRIAFAVFNMSGWAKKQVISVDLDVKRDYGIIWESWDKFEKDNMPLWKLRDNDGNEICAKISREQTEFGYDLPDDRFRQPYMAQRVRVVFEAEAAPMGYSVYWLEETEKKAEDTGSILKQGSDGIILENDFVSAKIHKDGSYTLTEKSTNYSFENVGVYEDTGDVGNEYIYVQDAGKEKITTKGTDAEISIEEANGVRAVVKIVNKMEIPVSMEETLDREMRSFVGIYQRKSKRSKKYTTITITTYLTLEKNAKGIKAAVTVENNAKDHRLRVLIPTSLKCDTHMADSPFEVVRRTNRHGKAWTNPSGCEHQQCFVAMEDDNGAILAANRGLYEYEILPDDDNTIAITLLRAVGEMGDWGYFPTPRAQMQGTYTMEYALFPYAPKKTAEAFNEGYMYQHDLTPVQTGMNRETHVIYEPQLQKGSLPGKKSFFVWNGEGLNLTAFKKGAKTEDVFVRFVNNFEHPITLEIEKQDWMNDIYKSNVIEEKVTELSFDSSKCSIIIAPFEIATFGFTVK